MNRPKGIALIQVLLLSVLLSVMLMAVNRQTNQQIELATLVQDRTHAMLALHSMEAELLFHVLTENRVTDPQAKSELSRQWNFFNRPFPLLGGEAKIEDMAGKVFMMNAQMVARLVESHSGNADLGKAIAGELTDWQDNDQNRSLNGAEQGDYPKDVLVRNAPMQTEAELRYLKSMTPELFTFLSDKVTVYPVDYLNPMAMAPQTLQAYADRPIPAEVESLKDQGLLSAARFAKITGIDYSEGVNLYPSRGLRMTFTQQVNSVRLSRQFTVTISPYGVAPVQIWDYQKVLHEAVN